jgi:hypothetical protein
MQTKEIAVRYRISPGTVRQYLATIFGGIGAHTRSQAQLWALQHPEVFLNGIAGWVELRRHTVPCRCGSSVCETLRLAAGIDLAA